MRKPTKPKEKTCCGSCKSKWPFRGKACEASNLELPWQLSKGAFVFLREIKQGLFAVYKKRDTELYGQESDSWEVIVTQVAEEDRVLPSGNVIPKGKESYPTSSQWGEYGWSYKTREQAIAKLLRLRSGKDSYGPEASAMKIKVKPFTLEHSKASMFPESSMNGVWRLQSTDKAIIEKMKQRCRQGNSWTQVGWGQNPISVDIFAKEFRSKRDAERAFRKIVK